MQMKFIRFQELMKDENNLDILVTVATLQRKNNKDIQIQSGPSCSNETHDLSNFKEEHTEIPLTSGEFDELLHLYENNKNEFLLFTKE